MRIKCNKTELRNELERVGVRPSVQRIAILGFMRENPIHPTADVVFEALKGEIGSLSLTTVYNTLKLFVEHGLISMLTIDDTFRCFDGDVSLHAHFMCKKCKKVIDLNMPEEIGGFVEKLDDFEIDEMQLYIKGFCKKCK